MRNYGQFCPIARGSEILAERWTPIILRNVLMGCHTFNQIAVGAPGLSRALLTRRLHKLEHAGVIQIRPKPDGHGSLYRPTPAGRDLWPVLLALGRWAERWMDLKAFFRGSTLAKRFANARAPGCPACGGRPLDTFLGKKDSAAAHAHGVHTW